MKEARCSKLCADTGHQDRRSWAICQLFVIHSPRLVQRNRIIIVSLDTCLSQPDSNIPATRSQLHNFRPFCTGSFSVVATNHEFTSEYMTWTIFLLQYCLKYPGYTSNIQTFESLCVCSLIGKGTWLRTKKLRVQVPSHTQHFPGVCVSSINLNNAALCS